MEKYKPINTEEIKICVLVSNEKFEIGDLICDGTKVIKATPKLVEAQGLVNRRDWRKVINKLPEMQEFIQEINERIEELQKEPTDVNIGKVAELSLVLLRLRKFNELNDSTGIKSVKVSDMKCPKCKKHNLMKFINITECTSDSCDYISQSI